MVIATYRDAAYAALHDLDAYATEAGDDAQAGPLAARARLRANLDALDALLVDDSERREHQP